MEGPWVAILVVAALAAGVVALAEDRIAAARRFYNANVREITQLCRSFPTNILAGLFGFRGGEFFELASEAERVVPRGDFGG